jgi:hypothetical protein
MTAVQSPQGSEHGLEHACPQTLGCVQGSMHLILLCNLVEWHLKVQVCPHSNLSPHWFEQPPSGAYSAKSSGVATHIRASGCRAQCSSSWGPMFSPSSSIRITDPHIGTWQDVCALPMMYMPCFARLFISSRISIIFASRRRKRVIVP